MGPRLAVVILANLALVAPARAGVYVVSAPDLPFPVPQQWEPYRDALRDREAVRVYATARERGENPPIGPDTPAGKFYELAKKLETKDPLTVEERIDLSAFHLLAGKPDKALGVLKPVERQDHFMIQAHLAVAHADQKAYDLALDYQRRALAKWPETFQGWTDRRLRWCRRVEQTYLKLLSLRNREYKLWQHQARTNPSARLPETLDRLFDGVEAFLKADKSYRVGTMDYQTADGLPPDALAQVKQLLLWTPHDDRLFWLLGELLNAEGELKGAAWVLDQLVWTRRFGPDLARRHRTALKDATPPAPPALEPGPSPSPSQETEATPTPKPIDRTLPDWRHLLAGFVVGFVFGILFLFQLRNLTRRSAHPKEVSHP